MAAAFSPSIHTLKCTPSKQHFLSDSNFLKFSPSSTKIARSYYAIDSLSLIAAVSWRGPRSLLSAAVAQEEAATTAVAQEEEATTAVAQEEAATTAVAQEEAATTDVAQEEVATTAVAQEEEATTAVAQEEAATTAVEEEGLVENEATGEVGVEAEQGEGGGEKVESPVNTKLYFGNLPYSVDSAQLAGIIQDYGSPEMVEVLYNRDTGRSRGFAFVTMSSIEDCELVINNLDGSQHLGRTMRVNYADQPKPKQPLYPETEHKLFVGNLSWSVTSESLMQAFNEYGNVVGARVLYDGESGRSRGYGFVCYATKSEMETALETLNGVELEGRAMRVSLAEGRKS